MPHLSLVPTGTNDPAAPIWRLHPSVVFDGHELRCGLRSWTLTGLDSDVAVWLRGARGAGCEQPPFTGNARRQWQALTAWMHRLGLLQRRADVLWVLNDGWSSKLLTPLLRATALTPRVTQLATPRAGLPSLDELQHHDGLVLVTCHEVHAVLAWLLSRARVPHLVVEASGVTRLGTFTTGEGCAHCEHLEGTTLRPHVMGRVSRPSRPVTDLPPWQAGWLAAQLSLATHQWRVHETPPASWLALQPDGAASRRLVHPHPRCTGCGTPQAAGATSVLRGRPLGRLRATT